MSSKCRVLARSVLLLVVTVAASSFAVLPQASAVTTHRTLHDSRPVGSAPVHVDFPIEYFGVVADLESRSSHLADDGPHGHAPYGEARFLVDGRWTRWRALEQDGAQAPGQFGSALLSVDRAEAYQVRGLPSAGRRWRAAAINTTDGPTVVVGHRPGAAADAGAMCRSRADWGADESISGWARGDQQTYHPVQALTVHHTAGSNNLDQNYAATMRAIYAFHVKDRGWSDIGYQYLVDGRGVVYEGRSAGHTSKSCLTGGGDGSDFAHEAGTDEGVTGAHVTNYNSGNLGIALMGCYEPGSSTCAGNTQPPAAALSTLRSLVASLASRHGLDPDGTVHYVNPETAATKDVPTVSGHRDWGATECPGSNLYALLPTVRRSTVAFQQAGRTVQENAGTVALRVVRTGNTALPATVHYAVTAGNATPSSDYTLTAGTLSFASGQTARTISATIRNDAATEGREALRVTLDNPGPDATLGGQKSTVLSIAPSDQKPDGWISTAVRSGYVGNNVYNSTGGQQTRTVKARRTTSRTFYVRVYNDGNVTNTMRIRGSAARSGSTVTYYSGSTNVTRALRSSAGWKRTLKPGAYALVTVRIAVLRSASVGSLKPAIVTARWTGDGTRADLVKGVVKVTR